MLIIGIKFGNKLILMLTIIPKNGDISPTIILNKFNTVIGISEIETTDIEFI